MGAWFYERARRVAGFPGGCDSRHETGRFAGSKKARRRVWEHVAKEKEGGLLPEEKVELDDCLKLEHL